MADRQILIVEDEEALATGLRFNFEQEGYEVTVAGDGPTALKYFDERPHPFDLVILDLMLPCMSGYETCREIRKRDLGVPVLVLSARTLSEDRTLAFDCGGDQYLTKPFALRELLSRARNLIQRREQTSGPRVKAPPVPEVPTIEEFTFGNGHIDFKKFQLTANRETVGLTTIETQLLRYFVEHESDVLSRSEILEEVWGESADITTRSIDNFVMRLRKYIEPDPANPRYLLSVRGTGYRFVAFPDGKPAD